MTAIWQSAAMLFRALREIGDPGGSTNPEEIRVAWQKAQSELDFDRRFNLF